MVHQNPTTPLPAQVNQLPRSAKAVVRRIRVCISCTLQAGLGRAGSILACYMIRHMDYTAENAIKHIRSERPGSIQSESQENALYMYEKRVRAD